MAYMHAHLCDVLTSCAQWCPQVVLNGVHKVCSSGVSGGRQQAPHKLCSMVSTIQHNTTFPCQERFMCMPYMHALLCCLCVCRTCMPFCVVDVYAVHACPSVLCVYAGLGRGAGKRGYSGWHRVAGCASEPCRWYVCMQDVENLAHGCSVYPDLSSPSFICVSIQLN